MRTLSIAILLLAFGGACRAAPTEAPVEVRTDHLPPRVAERVKQAAAQGPAALRRYVTITRGIYNLDLQALAVPEDGSARSAARKEVTAPKVAREDAAAKTR